MSKTYFKIVEEQNGQLKTVHFAINRSRNLVRGKWIKAELRKGIKDGTRGTLYDSGIHLLATREAAEDYMKKFKRITTGRVIVECLAKGIRKKVHSRADVYLANQIKII